jgi:hypothetical protein
MFGGRVTSWSARWKPARECRAVQARLAEQDGAPQFSWGDVGRLPHARDVFLTGVTVASTLPRRPARRI